MRFQLRILLLGIAAFLLSFLAQVPARAESLQITASEVKVYAQPDTKSEIITTLFKGENVPVSKKSVPGFKKVLITDGSNKKVGYIRIADLSARPAKAPPPQNRTTNNNGRRQTARNNRSLHGHYAFGLSAGMNYQYQNSRTYTDSNGGNADIGSLTGDNVQFSVFFDFPLSYDFRLHTYVQMKTVNVTGTATYQTSTVPAVPENTFLNETFISVGALAEFYFGRRSNWWWGPGLQVDHGNSGSLTFGSFPATTLQGSDLPNFVLAQVALGYDWRLFGSVYVIPYISIGGVLNALPIILEADGTVSFALGF